MRALLQAQLVYAPPGVVVGGRLVTAEITRDSVTLRVWPASE
jgi:hypothetical protein